MRVKNSVLNTVVALVSNALYTLTSFFLRKIFLTTLGLEIAGLNGVFTDIISVLSLVELGVGSAIIYSLYVPLAENNKDEIKSIMAFFKKIYLIIGAVVTVLGLVAIPFLDFFIKEDIKDVNIKFIFLFFIINTSLTYLLSYKRSILTADQKQYVINLFHFGSLVAVQIAQIAVLLLTKNYILYLILIILGTFVENILINRRVDKHYPYIKDMYKDDGPSKLSKEKSQEISKNTKALLMHNLAGKVVNSTDGIIISSILGVVVKAFYDNYNIVFSAIRSVLIQVFDGLTATIGNIHATETPEKSKKVFDQMFFLNFWVVGFSTVALFNLINPLIYLWLGEKYIIESITIFLLCLNFYFTMIRQTALVFRRAYGLYWEDRYKAIVEAVVNLVFSLILVNFFGLNGVIIGTIISNVFVCIWIEPLIMYKNVFKMSLWDYFKKFIPYFFAMLVALFSTMFTISLFNFSNSILHFVFKIMITAILPNLLFLLFFFHTKEFKEVFNIGKKFVTGFFKKDNKNKEN